MNRKLSYFHSQEMKKKLVQVTKYFFLVKNDLIVINWYLHFSVLVDDVYVLIISWSLKILQVVKLKAFDKFENTAEALSAATLLIDSKPSKGLRKFLKAHCKGETLAVADSKLGNAIKEKLVSGHFNMMSFCILVWFQLFNMNWFMAMFCSKLSVFTIIL